jgi:hypothetical protein
MALKKKLKTKKKNKTLKSSSSSKKKQKKTLKPSKTFSNFPKVTRTSFTTFTETAPPTTETEIVVITENGEISGGSVEPMIAANPPKENFNLLR